MVEIEINNSKDPSAHYVGWSARKARIRQIPFNNTNVISVTLKNENENIGGQVEFSSDQKFPDKNSIQLDIPPDGTWVNFKVAGKWVGAKGFPSTKDKDATIVALDASNNNLSTIRFMVRVRKDANTLTVDERDRFINAFITLNSRQVDGFKIFRDMHVENTLDESHGGPSFLPWHRGYLLDLERELQNIDPSVSLPYWKFDEKAEKLFTPDFIGARQNTDRPLFSNNNDFRQWRTDNVTGILRKPTYDPTTRGVPRISTELDVIGIDPLYKVFVQIEGDPHGTVHTSTGGLGIGYLADPATAPRDPIFFLLHANVDRLWALWQWKNRLYDSKKEEHYNQQGTFPTPPLGRVGDYEAETMWPWNGEINTNNRPPAAPGGRFPASATVKAPTSKPKVGEMIDYQGILIPDSNMGFDYDNVPATETEIIFA